MLARALPSFSLSPAARAQLGIFLFAYLLYSAARFVTIGDLGVAQANADWIMDLEDHLSVAVEASVQQGLTGTIVLWLLNHLYLAAQLVVLPGSLIFLYRRRHPMYERLRNTILATWVLSIPIYAAFPVAPPRLADSGLVDTITAQTGLSLDSSLTTSFYNELAAVPSLHVGFAVVIGVAVAAAVRNPMVKFAWLLWGPVDRPRRGRHRQPLRVRHRRRRGRRGPRLPARRRRGAHDAAVAGARSRAWPGPRRTSTAGWVGRRASRRAGGPLASSTSICDVKSPGRRENPPRGRPLASLPSRS